MSYKSKRPRQLSFRAAMTCLIAGTLALTPVSLAAQEPAAQQQDAESEASKEQRYKAHLAAGSTAYKNKDFAKALGELQAAYDLEPRASILFNMGLISEKKGDLKGASGYYREFIGAPDVGLSARKRASERLAVVNEIIDQSNKSEESQQTTDLMPALEAMNADFEEMGAEEAAQTSASQQAAQGQARSAGANAQAAHAQQARTPHSDTSQAQQSPLAMRNAGSSAGHGEIDYGWEPYAAFSVGTAAVLGGVAALALYSSSINDAKNTPEDTTIHEQHERNASDYGTMATGMFATGGVLIGLGTYFVLSRQAEHAESLKDDDSATTVSVGADYVGIKYSLDF